MEKEKKAGTAGKTGTGRQETGTERPEAGTGQPETGTERPEPAPVQKGLFTKAQLAASERFRGRRDLVEALLDEKELYTAEAAEEKIGSYMKGRVG